MNCTTNHTAANKIVNIELACQLSVHVTDQSAAKVQNSKATTQIHTINQINILPKKDHMLTSLGALSNIVISGFSKTFWFCAEFIQICELPIVGILPKFSFDSTIVMEYKLKTMNYFIFLNIFDALKREFSFSVMNDIITILLSFGIKNWLKYNFGISSMNHSSISYSTRTAFKFSQYLFNVICFFWIFSGINH
jgi:hypothetical protein